MSARCSILEDKKGRFILVNNVKVKYGAEITVAVTARGTMIMRGKLICFHPQFGDITIQTEDGKFVTIKSKHIKFIEFMGEVTVE